MNTVLDENPPKLRAASSARKVIQAFAVVIAVAAVTAIDFQVFHVNSATAGFSYLVLILGLATRLGLRESITASIVSVAAYNFFFLPPVGTFTIADPQNWPRQSQPAISRRGPDGEQKKRRPGRQSCSECMISAEV
jgi:K+-sensing histidine kinase KdpD